MNAIQDFFTKYHAVPAGTDGIDWANATDAALIGWAEGDARQYRDDPASRLHLTHRMVAVCRELDRRREALGFTSAELDRAALLGGATAKLSGAVGGLKLAILIEEAKR